MADETIDITQPSGPASPSDTDMAPQDPEQVANYWLTQIQYAERKVKFFRTRGDQIIRRYRNKRSTATPVITNITVGQRRMNILWSNVQLLKPVMYSQTPKPNVSRRNKDKDPKGRWAAIVLERVLTNTLEMQDFDHVMEQDVENLLLPGFAASMIEYIPQVNEDDTIGWQEARVRYVNWRDQLTNPARYWQEVTWWGYVSYLTRKEVARAYGPEIAAEIALDHKPQKDTDDSMSKATVWCIWDKTTEKIYHVSTGYNKAPLGVYDPPVKFEGFFPIPRPLVATTTPDSTVPTPDFDQYQDQADAVDMLTQRIYVLTRSLRLRGLYPGDMQSIKQMMDEGRDADLIPLENWNSFQERGGAQGMVAWFPIEAVAKTLEWCYKARDKEIETVYQITGVSDIMRGATDPAETATAQQIKGQYGNIRTRDRQKDVQRYIVQILRHMASVIGQHFEQPVLQQMSGAQLLTNEQKQMIQQQQMQFQQLMQQYQQVAQVAAQSGQQPPPPPQPPQIPPQVQEAMKEPSWEDVLGILRNEQMRGFVIDIETDSTIEADQMQQQAKATQFLEAVSTFMGAILPMIGNAPPQIAPALADLNGELLMFGVRHYKAGETIETSIENAVDAMKKFAVQMAQNPQPNPKMLEAQAKVQEAQIHGQTAVIKGQAEIQKAQIDLQSSEVDHMHKMREKAADMAANVVALHPPGNPVLPQ